MKIWIDEYLTFSAWMFVLTLVFYLPEHLFPAAAHSTRRDRLPNYLYLALALPLILFLRFVFGPVFRYLIDATRGGLVAHFYTPSQGIVETFLFALAFLLVWDFWQYGLHRLQHASPFLWETHRFHHSDEAVNATTQGRHHLLSHLLNVVSYTPIVLLFGAMNPHALAGVVFFRCWGFVNHANVRMSFGRLTSVIAGPQWHRIHHSIRPEHRDRNFATFFPFIDRMFGTYYGPAPDEFPATGLRHSERESFVRQASYAPLATWLDRARRVVRYEGNVSTSRGNSVTG
jgi:sterol desaturase/sphingolipid hydroxylase (fatty acid hydroxylase superfamily)